MEYYDNRLFIQNVKLNNVRVLAINISSFFCGGGGGGSSFHLVYPKGGHAVLCNSHFRILANPGSRDLFKCK